MRSSSAVLKTVSATDAEAADLRAQIRSSVRGSLKIMVFGPGPSSVDPASKKRSEIRGALRAEGHQVYYGEDLGLQDMPLDMQEVLALAQVDLVVNVAASRGSLGEAHDFGRCDPQKTLIWLPEKAKKAYIGKGLARTRDYSGGVTEYYTDADLQSCVLVLGSVDWVLQIQGVSEGIRQLSAAIARTDPLRRR